MRTGRLYDCIGQGYTATRRADPRIGALIDAALGDAETVINVGAGTGSYEPAGRAVTAVEPSVVMIAQRPAGAAPVVRATAENLPFADGSFDGGMAVWTIHHWDDSAAGLGELRRVARGPVVVATWDPEFRQEFWLLARYLPHARDYDIGTFPKLAGVEAALGGDVSVRPIPIPRDCADGFLGAFWARPEAYLDPRVRSGISTLRGAPDGTHDTGLARLAADLESGTWDARHGHLRTLPELDLGYRLIVATR